MPCASCRAYHHQGCTGPDCTCRCNPRVKTLDDVRREVSAYLPAGRAKLEQLVAAMRDAAVDGVDDADLFLGFALVLQTTPVSREMIMAALAVAVIDLAKRPVLIPGEHG